MNVRPQTLLSTLWIFVILNIFARDFHELGRPGMLQQVMSGVVDGVTITEELMLLGSIMIEIFIVMVALSQVLKYRVNRCVNMIVGPIAIMIVVMTNLSPDLDNIFFMTIEIITLLAIIGVAWRWKIETSQL
jgi:hypothetical protein